MITTIHKFVISRYTAEQTKYVLILIQIWKWIVASPYHHFTWFKIDNFLVMLSPYFILCVIYDVYLFILYEVLPFCICDRWLAEFVGFVLFLVMVQHTCYRFQTFDFCFSLGCEAVYIFLEGISASFNQIVDYADVPSHRGDHQRCIPLFAYTHAQIGTQNIKQMDHLKVVEMAS